MRNQFADWLESKKISDQYLSVLGAIQIRVIEDLSPSKIAEILLSGSVQSVLIPKLYFRVQSTGA